MKVEGRLEDRGKRTVGGRGIKYDNKGLKMIKYYIHA